MRAARPLFSVTQVQLGLGLGSRGVGSVAAPATGASAPQPNASSPDFPSHSAFWDAQTELRATDTDTESSCPAWSSFAEMQAGNLPYAEVRTIAKQETAAAASLSPKQARAEHSVVAAAAFADKREESRCPMGRASCASIHGSQRGAPRRDRGA
ncbi:hypothetical protein FIBSPDRAFT_552052 [Athelia psychrophila]|uniref:Uncharacterized protein n=1 Tax=Athelia psychrophila TaxID=1759441 RepID=A0A166UWG5_9AGAM|nr:hypothetical protein FIBSPDRAFT_552052 [Fibularhizoctonia sp. CBS 109695]